MSRDAFYLNIALSILYGTVWLVAVLYVHGDDSGHRNPFFLGNAAILAAISLTAILGVVHVAALHEYGREENRKRRDGY